MRIIYEKKAMQGAGMSSKCPRNSFRRRGTEPAFRDSCVQNCLARFRGIPKEQRQLQRLLRDHVKSAEFCPKVAKIVLRQGSNRNVSRFPTNLYILLGY